MLDENHGFVDENPRFSIKKHRFFSFTNITFSRNLKNHGCFDENHGFFVEINILHPKTRVLHLSFCKQNFDEKHCFFNENHDFSMKIMNFR